VGVGIVVLPLGLFQEPEDIVSTGRPQGGNGTTEEVIGGAYWKKKRIFSAKKCRVPRGERGQLFRMKGNTGKPRKGTSTLKAGLEE